MDLCNVYDEDGATLSEESQSDKQINTELTQRFDNIPVTMNGDYLCNKEGMGPQLIC